MVNINEWSKIHFYWYFGLFLETIFIIKNVYALFTMLVKNGFSVKIKTLKLCENLLKVSSEIKQYVKIRFLDRINDFDQVFSIWNNKN